MADANIAGQTPGQTTPAATTPAAVQQSQAPPTQTQSYALPEKFQGKSVEDVAKAYSELEKTMGTQANQYSKWSSLEKQLQPYGGLDNFLHGYNQLYQHYQQSQQQPQPPAQQPVGQQNAVSEYFKDWDILPAQQQAQKLATLSNLMVQQQVQHIAAQYAQRFQDAQEQLQQQQRREWDIYQRVMAFVATHPGTNPQEVMQEMVSAGSGDVNTLMEQAYRNKWGQKEVEENYKKQFETWKTDYQQQQANQQLASLNNSGGRGSLFSQLQETATNKQSARNAEIDKKLLESGFTAGHF